MARRQLVLQIVVAGSPAVLILVLGLWWALGSAPEFRDRPRGDLTGERSAASPHAEPTLMESLDAPSERAGPGPSPGPGDRSIEGTVITPEGAAAIGAEVVLVSVAFDAQGGETPRSLHEGIDHEALEARARRLTRQIEHSPRHEVNPDGAFAFGGLREGAFRVVARGVGFDSDVSGIVSVEDGGPPEPLVLRLAPHAALAGVVLGSGQTPVSGARIDARWRVDPEPVPATSESETDLLRLALSRRSATARSDPSGRFVVGGLRGGSYDLVFSAAGFARSRLADAPTDGPPLRVVLRPELLVYGEVVDDGELPVAEAEVRLVFLAADASDPRVLLRDAATTTLEDGSVHHARTDPDGRFKIGGLARGAYRAEVDHPGYLRSIVPLLTVHEDSTDEERDLRFELENGHSIHGLVESDEGTPLAGARVRARYDGAPPASASPRELKPPPAPEAPRTRSLADQLQAIVRRGQRTRSTRTDSDGSFEFTSLPKGVYRLDVSAGGHAPITLEGVATDGERMVIELERGDTVLGRVVDRASDTPVADARLSLLGTDAEPQATAELDEPDAVAARTDADGRFRFDAVVRGHAAVRVEAAGYLTLERDLVDLDPESPWELKLERSGSVSGRVHGGSRLPREGLRVSLRRHDLAQDTSDAGRAPGTGVASHHRVGAPSRTDAEGFYRIDVPRDGTYQVVVSGPPFVTTVSDVFAVTRGRQVEGIDIYPQVEATVQGIVTARDQDRVAGARVRVLPSRSSDADETSQAPRLEATESEARTDATGAFTIGGLGEGSYRVAATAPGYVRTRSEEIELTAGSRHQVELELEREMTIAGSVYGEGEAITAAEIRAVAVEARREGSGREYRTISDAAGNFRLSRLANRPYDLRVSAPDFASALLTSVPAGSDDVVVQLDRLVTLSGTVVGQFTGDPATDFRIRLLLGDAEYLTEAERKSLHRWRRFEDEDGAFSVDDLPPGRYMAEVDAPGHLKSEPTELVLQIGEGLHDVVLPVVEVGVIAGVVLDSQSEAIAGARVEAQQRVIDPDTGVATYRPIRSGGRSRDQEGGPGRDREGGPGPDRGRERRERTRPGRVRTESDGRFAMRDLPDGLYRLRITHDDYVPRDLGDYVMENGTGGDDAVAVHAFLAAGVLIRGRVRGLEEAQGGVSVYLRPTGRERSTRGRSSKFASVDPSGLFEMRGLEPGAYDLYARFRRASDGSGRTLRRRLVINEIENERTVLLDLSGRR